MYKPSPCVELPRILLPGVFRERQIQILQESRKTAREDAAKKRRDLPEGSGMFYICVW